MRALSIIMSVVFLSLATTASAQSLEETVITRLKDDGWTCIVRSKTLIGRVRLIGLREGEIREVVIEPRTSEILRDIVIRSNQVPNLIGSGCKPGGGN